MHQEEREDTEHTTHERYAECTRICVLINISKLLHTKD